MKTVKLVIEVAVDDAADPTSIATIPDSWNLS